MTKFLTVLKALLADIAALGTQGNAALVSAIAAGVVAVAAKLLGADLTVGEVTGWILLAASIAAGVEKLFAPELKAGNPDAENNFTILQRVINGNSEDKPPS